MTLVASTILTILDHDHSIGRITSKEFFVGGQGLPDLAESGRWQIREAYRYLRPLRRHSHYLSVGYTDFACDFLLCDKFISTTVRSKSAQLVVLD